MDRWCIGDVASLCHLDQALEPLEGESPRHKGTDTAPSSSDRDDRDEVRSGNLPGDSERNFATYRSHLHQTYIWNLRQTYIWNLRHTFTDPFAPDFWNPNNEETYIKAHMIRCRKCNRWTSNRKWSGHGLKNHRIRRLKHRLCKEGGNARLGYPELPLNYLEMSRSCHTSRRPFLFSKLLQTNLLNFIHLYKLLLFSRST